ncbi:hypothetical protein FCM35_KLT08034 [Carex littledalei]|uniref:F-box domain-containing protein n=1 Tax=Carex littledalei TaxID=544730 RepID=A0A833QWY2_9POAL|nr:hypothetical protein FCM35_KLT08034 [Carex littledalei]
MGGLWSQPNNKNQAWEQCNSSSVDTSKRLRMTSPQSCSLQISSDTDTSLIPALPDEISLQILARMPRSYYLTLKAVSQSWRNAVTDCEIYRLRKELGTTEEWLYVLTKGDDNKLSWHALDPINSIWQKLPPMPNIVQEEEFKRGLPGEVFDPVTNSWAEMPAGMGEGWPARQASSKLSTVVNGELYALDPSTSSDDSKIKIYDHHEDAWKVVTEKVPFRDCTDTEAPYLLTGFLGKLHVVAKDVNNDVKVFQMKLQVSGTGSYLSGTTGENEVDIWEVISTTKIAGAELVSCQVLSI